MVDSNILADSLDSRQAVLMWEILQRKWTIHILCELIKGPVRLSQLRRKIPAASKKALTASLRTLQNGNLICRRDLSSNVLYVEYELSGSAYDLTVALVNLLVQFESISRQQVLPSSCLEEPKKPPGTDASLTALL